MKNLLITLCLFSLFSLPISAQQTQSQEYLPYGVEKNMPASYQKMKETLTYPMAWGNSPIKDFNKWKRLHVMCFSLVWPLPLQPHLSI